MRLLIKKILKRILNIRKNKRDTHIKKIAKESSITLLDIGSAGGIERRWITISEELSYIGLEADCRSFSSLKILNGFKKYKIINSAVWNEKRKIPFYGCRAPQVSSLLKPRKDFLDKFPNSSRFDVVKKELIETTNLETELQNIEVDFAKLDIQGGELFALKGIKNHLKNCLGLELELEFAQMYEEQPLFGDLDNYLKELGFEFIDFVELNRWERFDNKTYGQCIFGDGLWLRTPEYVARCFSHKYYEYITICSLYGRYDLVYKIIDILELKLPKSYKGILDKLIMQQKNTRNFVHILNFIFRIISDQDTNRLHLIY